MNGSKFSWQDHGFEAGLHGSFPPQPALKTANVAQTQSLFLSGLFLYLFTFYFFFFLIGNTQSGMEVKAFGNAFSLLIAFPHSRPFVFQPFFFSPTAAKSFCVAVNCRALGSLQNVFFITLGPGQGPVPSSAQHPPSPALFSVLSVFCILPSSTCLSLQTGPSFPCCLDPRKAPPLPFLEAASSPRV